MVEFKLNQVVVVNSFSGQFPGHLMQIVKFWKNGVIVCVKYRDSNRHKVETLYNPGGDRRGSDSFSRSCIRPLKEGVTPDMWLAERKDADAQIRLDREKKEADHQAAVRTWWKAEGLEMWDNRLEVTTAFQLGLKGFRGKIAPFLLRFTMGEEELLVIVYIADRNDYSGGKELCANVSGLCQREGGSVGAWASSSARSKTVPGLLYKITH